MFLGLYIGTAINYNVWVDNCAETTKELNQYKTQFGDFNSFENFNLNYDIWGETNETKQN